MHPGGARVLAASRPAQAVVPEPVDPELPDPGLPRDQLAFRAVRLRGDHGRIQAVLAVRAVRRLPGGSQARLPGRVPVRCPGGPGHAALLPGDRAAPAAPDHAVPDRVAVPQAAPAGPRQHRSPALPPAPAAPPRGRHSRGVRAGQPHRRRLQEHRGQLQCAQPRQGRRLHHPA